MRWCSWRRSAAVLLVGAVACNDTCGYRGSVSLPDEGTRTPARLPAGLAWETPLIISSGDGRAPMGVLGATAVCSPATACAAHVVIPFVMNDDPKLTVVGLAPGLATVDLSYLHPARKETLKARLSFVFDPPETLETADVGTTIPAGPFLFAHLPETASIRKTPSGATAVGAPAQSTPLRCERSSFPGEPEDHCFPIEDFGGGVLAYPSCSRSARCSAMPGGVIVDGFKLCLQSNGGRVRGAALFEGQYVERGRSSPHPLGTWGTYSGSCDGADDNVSPRAVP